MNRKLFYLVLLCSCFYLFSACQDTPAPEETPVVDDTPETLTGEEIMAELKARSVEEGDFLGRLNSGIKTVQEEYTKSEPLMPDLEGVEVSINEQCLLIIKNGNRETRVDLHLLDVSNTGMSLIPDLNEGEFPGIRIETYDAEPVVQLYQNGSLVNKDNELVIFLATRASIERIAPALVQTIKLCQGSPE